MKLSTFLSGAALVASSVVNADLDPITIKGQKFFYKNGTEFFIRGVAYQQDMSSNGTTSGDNKYKDPLADGDACKRDVPLLQELRTNTIRTYAIDPTADHSVCMKLLSDAGIYVVSDLSEPGTSINRADPKWNDELYERYTAVIDELAQYDNVLGFFAGNEVSNNKSNTDASAFVKAAVRDMKSYIKRKNYRPMGVGYATNDDADIRQDMATYFNCGDSRDDTIDFWGYNIYSWCGDSTFQESGYDKVVEEFKNYGVPVFFAEYGCNNVKPRKFTDVPVLFGPQMNGVVSGGIVYMYFQEANQYGLVKVDGDNAEKLTDFNNLKEQMDKVNPTGVNEKDYNPSNTKPEACPTDSMWKASETLPPTPNKDLCGCMKKSLKCVVKDSVSDKDVGELFGTVCGMKGAEGVCDGINADATKGVYGAYSMCSPTEMLSWAMNQYYESQNEDDSACDFDGAAQTQTPTQPSGDCSNLMNEAGKDGTGQVTSQPSTDGSSGGSGGSQTSSSAAFPTAIPAFNFGILSLGAYVVCGVMAGASLILM